MCARSPCTLVTDTCISHKPRSRWMPSTCINSTYLPSPSTPLRKECPTPPTYPCTPATHQPSRRASESPPGPSGLLRSHQCTNLQRNQKRKRKKHIEHIAQWRARRCILRAERRYVHRGMTRETTGTKLFTLHVVALPTMPPPRLLRSAASGRTGRPRR